MRSVILAALAALATTPITAQAQDQAAPPIRVWLNRTDFMRADKAKAYLQTQDDGYVIVLSADPTGRVRVLFPLDPGDDDYVQGGKDYEIRGRSDREAFVVYQSEGTGYVYAAVSRDPFQFDGLALNGHWDYRAPDWTVGADPEADLTALVQRMAGGGTFDYDIARYDIGYDASPAVGLSMYDPYYGNPYWYGGSRFSINVGFGLWPSAYWYDPWWYPWYDPWYTPWYWGYAGLGWYGYQPFGYGYYAGWYGPRRFGTVYYAGNFGSPFVFKSHNDRWGLGPQPFGMRQRTPAPRTVLAGGTGTLWNGDFGRRTVTRTGPGDRVQPVSSGRRVAPQRGTDLGAVGPTRRPAPARQPEIAPSAPRSGARPAPRETRDGSTDLGRIGPTRRAGPAQQQPGARQGTPIPAQRPAPRAAPRGLRVDNNVPAPPAERRTAGPVTGREPQGVQSAPRSTARPATPSSGRSTRAQTPSLTRRSGAAPRASSPPRSVSPPRAAPPRSVSPPRSAPPRSASPPRMSAPRSAPPARSGGDGGRVGGGGGRTGGGGRRH